MDVFPIRTAYNAIQNGCFFAVTLRRHDAFHKDATVRKHYFSSTMIQDQLFILILGSILGTVFTAIGVPMLVDTIRFVRTAVKIQARVVGYEQREGPKPDGPGSFVYQHSKVEFEDQQGNHCCCTIAIGGDRQRYPAGSFVTVLFDPRNPCDVRIKSLSDLWQFPIMFTLGGLMGFGMSIGVWFHLDG